VGSIVFFFFFFFFFFFPEMNTRRPWATGPGPPDLHLGAVDAERDASAAA
jgi:hypothetical protein